MGVDARVGGSLVMAVSKFPTLSPSPAPCPSIGVGLL